MKSLFLIFFSLLLFGSLQAQVPSTCFEIESILVDACAEGNSCGDNSAPACQCEGKNEMFRFVVGPDDLDTDDMYIDWPNGSNAWQGVCQNANTASIIAELNVGITNCGFLLEPDNGILPSGANVLMITSTDMCASANSFAGLADTLIVIFQCTGNYYGHFANYSDGSNNLRTINVDFGAGCIDEATYDRSLLVDQSGANTAQDGARVDFTWDGDASYFNNGCNAPVDQELFDAGANAVLCPGDELQLNPTFSSTYGDPLWSGGTGIFVDATDPYTTYIPSGDEPAEFVLTFSATGCNGFVGDEIFVTNLNGALTGIEVSPGTTICDGESAELTATGVSEIFDWSTGILAPSITVTEPGIYTVSVNNACGLSEESVEIFSAASPVVDILNPMLEIICEGSTVDLNATSANGSIEWSTSASTASIEVTDAGWYYASVTNDCATVIDSVEVIVNVEPTVSITPDGPQYVCEGSSAELTAVGSDGATYEWSTDETTSVISVSEIGTYWITVTNDCGTASDAVEVFDGGSLPVAAISFDDDLTLCPSETIELQGAGDGVFAWDDASTGGTYTVDGPGTYTLSVSNNCGTDETSVTVTMDEVAEAVLQDGPVFALCNGAPVSVTVYGQGSTTWSNGSTTGSQTFTDPGEYYVVSTAACGSDTAYFQVIAENISAQFTAEPMSGEAPLEVDFVNQTSNAASVYWTLASGMAGYGDNASHIYDFKGDHEVIMQVTSINGCVDESSLFISVGACPFTLYVPKAFTPNGDRVNDILFVQGNCIEKFEWRIYDRWGRAVYVSNDPDGRWNGADVSGYAVLNGIYPYVITVTDNQAVTHRFTGMVTVIR